MKIRKAAAALTAVACFVGTFSGFPGLDTAKNVQAAVSNDFEINYGGWCKYGDAELIKQFVLGRITSFPKAVSQVDTAAMEALFANVTAATPYSLNHKSLYALVARFG